MSVMLALALAAAPAKPVTVFTCSFGKKQATVTLDGTTLTYRYGPRGKPELTIAATPESQTVFYSRVLYPRGEDQSLRFVKGDHSYTVYAHWEAPMQNLTSTTPETIYGRLIVKRGDEQLSSRACKTGGDMHEHPLFKLLPEDEANYALGVGEEP